MKIVTIQEMMKLPTGTIFSKYEPCICTGLFRKMENCEYEGSVDFFYQDLIPGVDIEDDCKIVFDTTPSRWAMFDHEEQFAVFDPEDVAALKAEL